jgi:hypothetical protein
MLFYEKLNNWDQNSIGKYGLPQEVNMIFSKEPQETMFGQENLDSFAPWKHVSSRT